MRLRHLIALSATFGTLAVAPLAHAADPQGFIEQEHQKLDQILRRPASAARDSEVNVALGTLVDYESLVQRAFGEPCHPSIAQCEDLWARWDPGQKKQLHDLLKQVIENSYRRHLSQTLDYDVSYKGSRDVGGDTRVLTEAKSKSNPRDTPVRVDYVVKQEGNGFKVVDIITEGSSFSKNLYVQFRKLDDYGKILAKLQQKLQEKDPKKD